MLAVSCLCENEVEKLWYLLLKSQKGGKKIKVGLEPGQLVLYLVVIFPLAHPVFVNFEEECWAIAVTFALLLQLHVWVMKNNCTL